jgi:hypothetical protein
MGWIGNASNAQKALEISKNLEEADIRRQLLHRSFKIGSQSLNPIYIHTRLRFLLSAKTKRPKPGKTVLGS